MKETVFSVSNVKCGGCVAKCEAALKALPGFVDAQFDIPGKTAVVRGEVDPQAVSTALTAAGYPADPKSA